MINYINTCVLLLKCVQFVSGGVEDFVLLGIIIIEITKKIIMSISIKFEFHIYINRYEKNKTTKKAKVSDKLFFELVKEKIGQLKLSLSHSTIENYKTALRVFKQYLRQDINMDNIDQELLKGFERWLREKNLCMNTISCYMRSLRSLINKIGEEKNARAFEGIYTGRAKTNKRGITEADIITIKQVNVRSNSFQSLTRDIFLFSYYALGMPFVDIAFLRRSQIIDNMIVYYRHKTGQRINVPLEPCIIEIINRYQNDSEYVFPLLKSEEPEKAYKEYLQMLNRYNRSLKSLAKKTGISLRLTSYTARHTWASVAYSSNVDLPIIAKALGHTNPQTTLTYIREINDDRLAAANHEIVNRI